MDICYYQDNECIDHLKDKDIKKLLNSVLTGYEELLRQRFVLSAEAKG